MELKFQLTREDFVQNEYLGNKKNRISIYFIIPALLCYCIINFVFSNDIWNSLIVFLISSLLSLYSIIPFLKNKRLINKIFKSSSEKEVHLKFSDEGIEFISPDKTKLYSWNEVFSVSTTKTAVIFTIISRESFFIPKAVFKNIDEENEFASIVRNARAKLKENKIFPKLKTSPPYWAALLCILPVVGIICGIVVLLLSIFKWHSKALSIFAIAGVVISVFVTINFFREIKKFRTNDDLFKGQIVHILNGVVTNLEFYKLKRGTYPDSLEQLLEQDTFSAINDPVNSFSNPQKKFHYLKKANKYYLFSEGYDTIPFTSDDIYPTITNGDTLKFGLIFYNH